MSNVKQGSHCLECGPNVLVDEDGLCSSCGRDAMWWEGGGCRCEDFNDGLCPQCLHEKSPTTNLVGNGINTTTFPGMIKGMNFQKWAGITHHEKTANNNIGQSGLHTFVDDIIEIVLNSKNEQEAYKKLHLFLLEGGLT
ncbi:hypothetical protein KAR91_54815 [Candidatus Pacearchaeota archaeon]|nr:hypothetical protein [Candidatus Pacearchaeota archaeon]